MAAKAKTKTVYVQSKPEVDEFGEIAKSIVIVVGCIAGVLIALIMIWQFIHWAATPDLSAIDAKLSYIDTKLSVIDYAQQQRLTTTTGTITAPAGSSCEYTNGLINCHPQP